MLFIVPAILLSILLLLLFRVFPSRGVNSFSAILFNYLFAALSGYILSGKELFSVAASIGNGLYYAIPLGALFLAVFYLISQTTQKVSVSAAAVANKMSVILPFLFSLIALQQEMKFHMILGIILALVSVYLTSQKKEQAHEHSLWLPALVFLGSGSIDTSLNAASAWLLKGNAQSAVFSMVIFLSAFCFGALLLLAGAISGKLNWKEFLSLKNVFAGLLLGVPNYFSIYFIFLALDSKILTSSQLFPVLNVANVALSALSAWIFFKEKLQPVHLAGIGLAILSIFLLAI